MADSILRLRVQSDEYDNKLKRAAEGLTRYADECRKAGGTLQYVDEGVLEFTRSLGKMDTVAKTTTGSLSEMKKTYTELSAQYRKMTDEEKKGEYGQALRQSLDQLRGRIKDTEGDLKDINKELNGSSGLSGALDSVTGKLGLSIKQLTGWGAALGAGKMALDVAKDAFFQSETNIDEWGRTLKGAEGAYQVFLDTLNNGNWSNFFSNLETAIRGGRDLYDVFDRLGSIKSNNAAAIAIVQQQIAQLRLAKQQGQDVDDQLKAATARLAALQKQSIQAGKAAGNQTAFNVIRNGVNSIGGARINDATINLAVSQLMTGGQAQFDKFRNNRDILRQRGMVTRTQTIVDSQGGTYQRQYKEFDINALSREQQKQYALAQAITEGETRIQAGIAAFAQAVNEGTASAREEFKGNRYALQGSHGGGSTGGSGGSTPVPVEIKNFDPSAAAAAGEHGVDTMPSVWAMMNLQSRKPYDLGKDISTEWRVNNKGELTTDKSDKAVKTLSDELKKNSGVISGLAGGLNSITSGIKAMGFDLPDEIDEMINGISGLAQIISGVGSIIELFGSTSQAANTIAVNANTATMVGLIDALAVNSFAKMVPFMARGGVVPKAAAGYLIPGNSMSGDNVFAGHAWVNSGELILNKSSQDTLAAQLENSGLQNLHLEAVVTGSQIKLALKNDDRLQGGGSNVIFK